MARSRALEETFRGRECDEPYNRRYKKEVRREVGRVSSVNSC